MKSKIFLLLMAAGLLSAKNSVAQTYDTNNEVVEMFAGYGIPGYVDGQGQQTAFSNPQQIVSDTSSNLYVWDSGNARIRKITPDGTVSTFAGGGTFFEGYGANANLAWGTGGTLAIDHANTIWLVFSANYTYGGYSYFLTVDTNGYVAIENGGITNLSASSGICFDSANNLYYSGGNRIYRYDSNSGNVQAIAGSGIYGNFDGPGPLFSAFNDPMALACDQADNLYVWDSGNHTIRRIDPDHNVTTIAGNNGYSYSNLDGFGTNAFLSNINSMFTDNQGNLYLICNTCVRKIDAQTNVVTLAGTFNQSGYANGPGNLALFNNASGGCLSQGMVFVADAGNNRIRNIVFNQQPQTIAPASLQLNTAHEPMMICHVIFPADGTGEATSWNPCWAASLTSSRRWPSS